MNRLHLKENCFQPMDTHSLSPRLGRKRRSSILKPQRPFTDVQNLSRGIGGDDSRTAKDRRVSFCPTIEVKEFSKHSPTDPTSGETDPATRSRSDDEGAVTQVSLPGVEDEVPQMSTPVRKKRRRISAPSQIARLSIIPKFEKSFAFPDDDFVIFEDRDQGQSGGLPPATAPHDEITLLEDLPEPHPPTLEDDVMLDLELNEAPMNRAPPDTNQLHSEPSPPTNFPRLTDDENQRLAELFPSVAVSPPANAPTIIGTPAPYTSSYFVAISTPEKKTTPRRLADRRRINISADDQLLARETGEEDGGVASMELTAGCVVESPLSRGGVIAEPRSMDLTCFSSHPSTSHNTPALPSAEPSLPAETTTFPRGMTVIETRSMDLTCFSTHPSTSENTPALPSGLPAETTTFPRGMTVIETRSMDLTCFSSNISANQDTAALVPTPHTGAEPEPGTIANTVAMSLTCDQLEEEEGEGGVSCDNHVISAQSAIPFPSPQLSSGGESQEMMDITCQSETTTTSQETGQDTSLHIHQEPSTISQDTSLTSSRPVEDDENNKQPADLDKSSPAADKRSLEKTYSVGQGNGPACGIKEQKAVAGPEEVAPATNASQVFKAPKRPLRTQLSLKSSGKRVVIASPIVPTPRHTSSLSLSSSLSHHPLNTTFTVPPLCKPRTPAATPSNPQSEEKEVATTNIISSLLSSPLPSAPSPLALPPTHPCTGWLQSPGESFNLVHSEDETLTPTQEDISPPEPHPPPTPQQLQTDSQGNITSTLQETPTPQEIFHKTLSILQKTPVPLPTLLASSAFQPKQCEVLPQVVTPVFNNISSQTARLAAAIHRLKVSGPPVVLPEIVTPETAMVANPPPPTAPSSDQSIRSAKLNDTTVCSSPLLSTSIYDKFLGKIYKERNDPLAPAADTETGGAAGLDLDKTSKQETATEIGITSQHSNTSVTAGPMSSTLFSSFLSDLTSRLQDMLHGIHRRLNSEKYCSTHKCLPLVLDKWSRIFAACLGTLTVLEEYGKLSGDSNTHCWQDEGWCLERMPLPAIGQEDMEQGTLSVKLDWIMELSGFYSTMRPTAELARDEAAQLYGWLFEDWSYATSIQNVTVVLGAKPHHFKVSVADMIADRVGATRSVAETVWRHVKNYGLHDCPLCPV